MSGLLFVEAVVRDDAYPPSSDYLATLCSLVDRQHVATYPQVIEGAPYGGVLFACTDEADADRVQERLLTKAALVTARRRPDLRSVTVCFDGNKERQELDLWQLVSETALRNEVMRHFRDNPKAESVWVVPCQFGDGKREWTAHCCCEMPYSNAHRRLYSRSFARSL